MCRRPIDPQSGACHDRRVSQVRKRVAVWGLGRAGTEILRAIESRPDFELAAAITTSAEKEGKDAGELAGGRANGVFVGTDVDAMLADPSIDVVLYAGLGSAEDLTDRMGQAVDAGKGFITVSGFIHPPTSIGAEAAAALDRRAVAGGGWILGTGVNPGYVLDALPAAAASLSVPVKRITARRVNDMRYWGDNALRYEGGCGWDPDELEVSEHLSLISSLALLADHFGGMTGEPTETHKVLVSEVPRSDGRRSIEAGQTMGFSRRAAVDAALAEIAVEWTCIFCIDPEQDGDIEMTAEVEIEGASELTLSIKGYGLADSYPATAARAISAIHPLLSLPPGLYRPDQVPATPRG